jgi:hypothetical protein
MSSRTIRHGPTQLCPSSVLERLLPLARRDSTVAVLLLACLVAMFWKVVFTSEMFFYRDVYDYSYPHALFIHDALRHGHLPYWNPLLNYGEPVLANPNFLFFYPDTLLIALLPLNFAYTLHYILHFALAAIGTYLLLRRWNRSRSAAFFAAFFFTFSGPMLSLGNFYNEVACAAWIPWALLVTDRAVESFSRRSWVLLVLVFSLQFLAAEPLTLLATFGLCLAYAMFMAASRSPSSRTRAAGAIVVLFAVVGVLMVGLVAVQLLPATDLLRHSRRGVSGFPYGETTYWSLHPVLLLQVILPDFFFAPFQNTGLWSWLLNFRNAAYFPSVFVGFVPCFFALVGWAYGRSPRRRFLAAASVTLAVLALGKFTPVFKALYLVFPPLHVLRFPAKLLVPAVFLIATLAGYGIDVLLEPCRLKDGQRKRVLIPLGVMGALALLVWVFTWILPSGVGLVASRILRWTHSMVSALPSEAISAESMRQATEFILQRLRWCLPGFFGYAMAGVLVCVAWETGKNWTRMTVWLALLVGCGQLVLINSAANPTVPKEFYTYRPPVLTLMPDVNTSPFRYCDIHRSDGSHDMGSPTLFVNFDSIAQVRDLPESARGAFRSRLIATRAIMLTGAEGIAYNDVEWSYPPFLHQFWVYVLRDGPSDSRMERLIARTNVKYFISPVDRQSPDLWRVGSVFDGSSQPLSLQEDSRVAPRVYIAGTAIVLPDPRKTLELMSSPNYDPAQAVILAELGAAAPANGSGADSAGRVAIVERQANRVVLHAEMSRPGYVVLLDRFDTNWHAALDGKETPVMRANQLFRAVYTPAGAHGLCFEYKQKGLLSGLLVSAATLLLLTFLAW